MTTISSLIPANANYSFDANSSTASVTIETRASRPGDPRYATVSARLSVGYYDGEPAIDAEYVSHEGDATQDDIDHALRVIETNDFGV